jgi:hypothetical protein
MRMPGAAHARRATCLPQHLLLCGKHAPLLLPSPNLQGIMQHPQTNYINLMKRTVVLHSDCIIMYSYRCTANP